jgi:CheY-like chemotaxis protein
VPLNPRLWISPWEGRVNPTVALRRPIVGLPRLWCLRPEDTMAGWCPESSSSMTVFAEAGDAHQALDAAADACPDGILIDINLPGPDGFMVATALAAACPAARIVLTSANVAHVPEHLLRDCAAIAFVPKEELVGTDLGALFMPAGT